MVDVGLGQDVTMTGRARSRVLKDAVRDNHPLYAAMEEVGGISDEDGGRTIVEEAKTAQNTNGGWVGPSGAVSLGDQKVFDAAEYDWHYQLRAVAWTLAEEYQNSGGSMTKFIDLIGGKFEVAEDSMMNEFHAAMLSNGTGDGGLEMPGLAALVSTTPTSGTVGGIDRSSANAAWFRNQKFDTSSDWSEGSVDAGNWTRFMDKGINATMRGSKVQVQLAFAGQTHFEAGSAALRAIQRINDVTSKGKAGFDKIEYRGVPIYFGNGINYSGETAATLTRTYLLNVKPGGVNLRFHKKAKFDLLDPVNSADQAARSRLMFTMSAMVIGGLAKFNWVGFD